MQAAAKETDNDKDLRRTPRNDFRRNTQCSCLLEHGRSDRRSDHSLLTANLDAGTVVRATSTVTLQQIGRCDCWAPQTTHAEFIDGGD